MSLKILITNSYGADTYNQTNQLKSEKIKKAKLKNQIIFLQRCISHKIIPKSLRVHCPVKSRRGKNVTAKYRFDLLLCAKNDAKSKLFQTIKRIDDLREILNNKISHEHMQTIENVTLKSETTSFQYWKNHLQRKFVKLDTTVKPHNINPATIKPTTLNLCADEIPQHHKELLDLGPKFVPVQARIPYMDIISKAESTALKLMYEKKEDTDAMKIRQDVLRDLKMSKPPKNNLTKNQRQALKELKNDDDVSIYPYDKGAGLVRIPNPDAIRKIEEQIGNTEIIDKDPTPALTRKFQTTLRQLKQQGKFTDAEYKQLYPSDPIPPRMYGVVKAHKPEKNFPMRIVVSTVGTPNYRTSEYLVKIIQPTLNKNKTRLKNSYTFVETSKTWSIENEEVQVSYDVVNLYPSVPVKEATDIIIEILSTDPELTKRTKLSLADIRSLIDLCLSKCYFLWEEKIYLLKNSAPIGLALMVVIAEAFLQYHEKNAIDTAQQRNPSVAPKSFLRYVDDSHVRFQDLQTATQFYTILNEQDPHIQYTMETENFEKSLQFLDLDITNINGRYEYKIHRKNAITNVQVKPNSGHDPKVLKGIFTGFLHRAHTICEGQNQKDEIDFLVTCFVENGYDESELKKIIADYLNKRKGNAFQEENLLTNTVTLPWIPGLSPKLRKSFRK